MTGASPLSKISSPYPLKEINLTGRPRGVKPLFPILSLMQGEYSYLGEED